MKKKLLVLLTVFFTMTFTAFVSNRLTNAKVRVHQHKIAKPKQTCNHDSNIFCTHLPLMSIDTGGQPVPGELRDGSTIKVNISIFDHPTANNHLTDPPTIVASANIRYRGHSSIHFDKKGYKIEFINEDGSDKDISLMGMDEHHEWALHGPFLDKTLIRNYLWYNISGEIMDYAPNVRFCELVVDGRYQGLYLAVETITRSDSGRLNITKYNPGDPFTSYIIRLDRGHRNPLLNINHFTKYARRTGSIMDIRYPPARYMTAELNTYIKNDFSRFEKALYSFDYDSKTLGYEKYINTGSFVDYFIINEFTQNYDAGSFSTYLYKDLKGKLNMVVWDFNNSCDNYQETAMDSLDFQFQNNVWYFMLMKDERFTEKIIKRYFSLRKTFLSDEYLLNYIDETIDYLGDAVDRNFDVWGYTFSSSEDLLYPSERNPTSYEEAVDQLKNFIIQRGRWMDQYIVTLRQFSHESKIKKFNH